MSSSSSRGLCDGEFDDGYSFGLIHKTSLFFVCFFSLFVLRRGQKRSPKKGEREREREVSVSLFFEEEE